MGVREDGAGFTLLETLLALTLLVFRSSSMWVYYEGDVGFLRMYDRYRLDARRVGAFVEHDREMADRGRSGQGGHRLLVVAPIGFPSDRRVRRRVAAQEDGRVIASGVDQADVPAWRTRPTVPVDPVIPGEARELARR